MKAMNILLLLLMASCTKEELTTNPVETKFEECLSVTYVFTDYDDKFEKVLKIEKQHWCEVCGTSLDQQRRLPVSDTICGTGRFLVQTVIISKDTCKR